MATEKQIKYWATMKGKKSYIRTKEIRRKHKISATGKKYSFKKRPKAKGRVVWNKGLKGIQVSHQKGKPNLAFRGEKNPRWKGGITPINEKIRKSLEYKLWRESVFKRDKFTCIWCRLKSGNGKSIILNADHIKPFSLYPELRFAIDNGRTLCVSCHRKTETYGNKKIYH